MIRPKSQVMAWLGVMAIAAGVTAAAAAAPGAPLRVLLLSGRNNHDWRHTTPVIKDLLEASSRFAVQVTESPEKLTAAEFAGLDVVLSNWNTFGAKAGEQDWPAATKTAFLDFVKGGKGFVVVHAGGSTLYDWTEFHRLIGGTWGKGTGHGPRHRFFVRFTDVQHPVTAGLPPFWTTDELWHRMAVQKEKTILATAFSDKAKGGSGEDEPVVMVTRYGDGRCFNLVLGHDVTAMAVPGWQALLLRGTEWAATGKVTVSAAWPYLHGLPAKLEAVRNYRFGQSREPLRAVENLVYAAGIQPALRSELNAKLVALLTDEQATVECRRFVCDQLSLIGTDADVPALAGLLGNAEVGFAARGALERLPGEVSLRALRAAVGTTHGELQIGIVNSLGQRRDAAAVEPLAARLGQAADPLRSVIVGALGKIGTAAAAKVLLETDDQPKVGTVSIRDRALLLCADRLAGEPANRALAARIYRDLSEPGKASHIRRAAFAGRIVVEPEKAPERLAAALADTDPALRQAAVDAVRRSNDAALLDNIARQLDRFPPAARAGLLEILAGHAVTAALPAAMTAARSENGALRHAALAALGTIGDAAAVPVLLAASTTGDAADRAIIQRSLVALTGDGVDAALGAAVATTEGAARLQVIEALQRRGATPTAGMLLPVVRSDDAKARRAALKALQMIGRVEDCAALIAVLDTPDGQAEKSRVVATLAGICGRAGDPDTGTQPLRSAYRGAKPGVRAALATVLGRVGGPASLKLLRAALADADPEVRTAAIRGLGEWPDAAPMSDLLAVAEREQELAPRVLALRGFAALASKAPDMPLAEKTALFERAFAVAGRAEERRELLQGLAVTPHPTALRLAASCLEQTATADEAGLAVVQLAPALRGTHRDAVRAALQAVLAEVKNPELRQRASAELLEIDKPVNLARGATASSPDGLEKDGAAGGDAAGIDGNPATYWDERDGAKLYRYRVTFPQRQTVNALRIVAYQHHSYSPKDFVVLCDDKPVQEVKGAVYSDTVLNVAFPAIECQAVELKITGYYGASPAIRELELYHLQAPPGKQ